MGLKVWHGNNILKGVNTQSKRLIKCIALKISRDAKLRCPVLTSNLKRSIRPIISKDKTEVRAGGEAGCAPGVGTPVEYAAYVELGTSKTVAQPFLIPAVEGFSKSDLNDCLEKIKGD